MGRKKNYNLSEPRTFLDRPPTIESLRVVGKKYFGNHAVAKIEDNSNVEFENDFKRANIRVILDYKVPKQTAKKTTFPSLQIYSATKADIELLMYSLESALITLDNVKRQLERENEEIANQVEQY